MDPDVVVSIVNTSNRAVLLDCLDSFVRIPSRCTIEVCVLDNASDDGSAAAVRRHFPEVRLIEQTTRRGFGANHNAVMRATGSRYVLVLNDDTLVPAGAIESMVAYLDAHPRVGAVGPRLLWPDGSDQDCAWRFPGPAAAMLGAVALRRKVFVQSRGPRARPVDWATGAALMLRRSAIERIGLFDEGYFIYFEDPDVCRRLAYAGFETHFLPTAGIVHIGSATTGALPERQLNEQWRSQRRYLLKHHSPAMARATELLCAWQHGARGTAFTLVRRLPARLRPIGVDPLEPAVSWLNARNALTGSAGPGIRESAEAWNDRRARDEAA